MYLRDMPLPPYMLTHHGDLNLTGLDHMRAVRERAAVVILADAIAAVAASVAVADKSEYRPQRVEGIGRILIEWCDLIRSTPLDNTLCEQWARQVAEMVGYTADLFQVHSDCDVEKL